MQNDKLSREYVLFVPFAVLLFVTGSSGFLSYVIDWTDQTFAHWNTLGHAILGVFFIPAFLWYGLRHFLRAVSIRRYFVHISGVVLFSALLTLCATGLYIVLFGQAESKRWIYALHVYAGITVVCFLLLHVLIFYLNKKNNKNLSSPRFLGFKTAKYIVFFVSLYALFIFSFTYLYDSFYVDHAVQEPQVADYAYMYGHNPFLPSQTETPDNQFIHPRQIANSNRCGVCHQEIYQQWSASMHAQAASDPTYVKNVNLLESNKGIAATRYCEGCHAPVALLTGELSEGGQHGGVKDTLAHHEGVGCMACHGISRIVHLQGVASYAFQPDDSYLFADDPHPLARKLHNFLLRLSPGQHRADMARPVLHSAQLCATCHEQFMDKSMNDWGWVKMQDEYSAWLGSPFSGQTEQAFSHMNEQNCQSCHFELVAADDPSADAQGKIHSHRTPGANTAIPWLLGDAVQYETVKRFLQANKVLVSIDSPQRNDVAQSLQFVDESIRSLKEQPYFLYLGEQADIRVTTTNSLVGHNFPAGTTDINQAWIHFRAVDANNQLLYESGAIDGQGFLDTKAHVYQSIPIDRQGNHVWKHDLFQMVGDAYKKVIPSGKSDIVSYQFKVPYWAQGPITITASLQYRKFNQRYAKWALDLTDPALPVIEMSRDTLSIALRDKPPVVRKSNN